MSYSIATSLKIQNNIVFGKAGANNIRPFYTSTFKYEDKELFMVDVLSGGLTLDRVNTKTSQKVKNAIDKVKSIHKYTYGEMQEKYMYGWFSINPFSLFEIGNVYLADKRGDKDIYLKNTGNIKHVGKDKITETLVNHAIIKGNWDEYIAFYKMLIDVFFKTINS